MIRLSRHSSRISARHLAWVALAVTACKADGGAHAARGPSAPAFTADSAHIAPVVRPSAITPPGAANAPGPRTKPTGAPASPRAAAPSPDTTIVRALYVNRWASQSEPRMRGLVRIADSSEINALVIDLKDEFGLNYESVDSLVRRHAGSAGHIPHLAQLLDTLKAHHIRPIARLVVFKDSVTARLEPEHTIRKEDGTAWHDKKGLTWVDPYDHAIWEYNIRVAVELAQMGFSEIQFDYIRFPEPYKSLPTQVFRDVNGVSKPEALSSFFRAACPRIHAAGARCTADIFGMVATVPGALEVGQSWQPLAPEVDVLLPMVYPSHYPHGSFGLDHPNAEPYAVISAALTRAHARDRALGILSPTHVRPWLQAFSLKGMQPKYGAHELEEQKRAVYDAGYDGWVLWNPGSVYEPYLPALERKRVSHRKTPPRATDSTRVASARADSHSVASARSDTSSVAQR
ncbi:MAG TPA: putative glycoside hydrolase [Gemmatimonadaceae bacterium]|nr:putative glycoside hydrolase [Gemmatimonadaceae bacterium]